MIRSNRLCLSLGCLASVTVACIACVGGELAIERSTIAEGGSEWDWFQARTATVPIESPFSLTTMSRTAKVGSHGYHDIYAVYSDDHGRTWSQPSAIPSLVRTRKDDGYEVVAGDLWPFWHSASGKVVITGKTFNFAEGTKENYLREAIAYCVFDPQTRAFGPLRTMPMPERDHSGHAILAANAGCNQPVVLADGEILLPVRYQRQESVRNYTSIVARCRFDGSELLYVAHGTEHTIGTNRGLYEPSAVAHRGMYYLTLRADDGAYVAKSENGIDYSDHIPWRFDDGELLGSYNTQQHWVSLGGRLYLVYTRRGANNDHVMRHRAPLFVAEVDCEKLTVIRRTEQVLVPENHATLGNSGVCRINDRETWITVAEGRVSDGPRQGANNLVILAKLRLRPSTDANQ